MKKRTLYNQLKIWLLLGTAFSVATLSISCSKNVEKNENKNNEQLNEMAKNIDVNYTNKQNINIEESKKEDIKFANFDNENYEVIEFNIANKNKETNTMEISFKLRNKQTNQTSNLIKKTISNFKKDKNLPKENINDLAAKVEVTYENQKEVTVDLTTENKAIFSNYDKSSYEIIDKSISKKDEVNGAIEVSFKLKNTKNNQVSEVVKKEIKEFKIKQQTLVENINDLASKVEVDYENKDQVTLDLMDEKKLIFSNFDKNSYEIIVKNIFKKGIENGAIEVSFKLKNTKNNKLSKTIRKDLKGFKIKKQTPVVEAEDLNILAINVEVEYLKKESVYVDSAQLDSVTFTSYDENRFEIVDKTIKERNEFDSSIEVSFVLKNKTNNELSFRVSKAIFGFKAKNVSDMLMDEDEDSDETVSIPGDKKTGTINETEIQKYNLKVGHWNILNYGAGKSQSSIDREKYQATAVSEVISKNGLDLVGLTEINYEKAENVQQIVDLLNKSQEGETVWNYVFQPTSDTNPDIDNKNVHEQIAIVFKTNVFKPVEFDDNKNGASFVGSFSTVQNEKEKRGYVRPLYGHKFEHINSKKTFTFIFGHFDSPDAKKKSGEKSVTNFSYENKDYSLTNSQGQFEATEAINLAKALEYFDRIDGDSTLMFAGDTNIKYGNRTLFQPSIEIGYKLLYGDEKEEGSDKYATSLKRPKSGESWIKDDSYSQPYDRIIFKEANGVDVVDESENPSLKFKVDIVNAFNSGLLDLEKYKKLFYRTPNKKTPSFTYVNYLNSISDHVLVFANIVVSA